MSLSGPVWPTAGRCHYLVLCGLGGVIIWSCVACCWEVSLSSPVWPTAGRCHYLVLCGLLLGGVIIWSCVAYCWEVSLSGPVWPTAGRCHYLVLCGLLLGGVTIWSCVACCWEVSLSSPVWPVAGRCHYLVLCGLLPGGVIMWSCVGGPGVPAASWGTSSAGHSWSSGRLAPLGWQSFSPADHCRGLQQSYTKKRRNTAMKQQPWVLRSLKVRLLTLPD